MSFSVNDIKVLREKTGAGMGACKEALTHTNGNIEEAVVYLRKKGLADMAKRAGREIKEGRVAYKTDGKNHALIFLGCETDFVSATPEFVKLAGDIADYVVANPGKDYVNDPVIKATIEEIAPKFGENTSLKGAYNLSSEGKCGVFGAYIHSDNKKACLMEIACAAQDGSCCAHKEKMEEIAKALAMQAVGMVAQYMEEKDVPAEVIEKEKEVAIAQAKAEGKPEAAIEKMLPGRVQKFFKDVCLLDQPTIKNNKLSVRDWLKEQSAELGFEIKAVRFVKF